MANIRPFSAYRPAPGMEDKIAALPYDVYDREEAAAEVKRNPDSFLAIDRGETGFGPEVDTYAPEVYERAAALLRDRILEGKFVREDRPCYYVYELTMEGRSQTGIVACASIDDYNAGVIKKHENTRADKERDRIRHVDVCNMQTGPIFLAYRFDEALSKIVGAVKRTAPACAFVSEDGIGHRVWVIGEESQVESIRQRFDRMDSVYIADGHHRCASAVKVGMMRREARPDYSGKEEFNYFLSVLFPDRELHIMDYNRVVHDLNGLTREAYLEKVSERFEIREAGERPYSPEGKGRFGMYLDGSWYVLTARPEILSEDAVDGLDVSLLQNHLLGPVLGIQDPKTDKRIDFVGGIRGLEELERRVQTARNHSSMAVAFSMYPTSMDELFAVADAGRLMPPKSTWFEPKLRSGLFLHELGE
ncbi:MAG: DUF1015 domain-containing protein [Lachnospiraceae bacterium]|nr:DUF1015 domain-containing protein [Lachnospiraceae bacterium]